MRLVLASQSPRRRELLKEICPDFEVIPARGAEVADLLLPPEEVVQILALHKAREVAAAPEAGGKSGASARTR